MQEATRIIPLISSKQLNQKNPTIPLLVDVDNSYMLPLKFNQAGVMPIILTTALLVIPNYIINSGIFPWLSFLQSFKFIYWIGYFALILIFSSFYSSIVLNPKDISDQLQKMAVTIPGVRPGLQTTFYLKKVIKRITLIGATAAVVYQIKFRKIGVLIADDSTGFKVKGTTLTNVNETKSTRKTLRKPIEQLKECKVIILKKL